MKNTLVLFFAFLFYYSLFSQDAQNRSVQVSAEIHDNPTKIDFSWSWDWSSGGYTIYRKSLEDQNWGEPIGELPWGAIEWSDTNVLKGVGYEYAFFKQRWDTLVWTVEVPIESELNFIVENTNGSGLCCNFGFGWYKVESCGEIVAYGDNFGDFEETTFWVCSDTTTTTKIEITLLPDLLTNTTSWSLENAQTGQIYGSSGPPGTVLIEKAKYGFIYAGINLPPIEKRGTILLMVDDVFSTPLQGEIEELKHDLFKDGWKVVVREANRNEAVTDVKARILEVYQQENDLKALYLLGNIPVPYSGDMYPDGHSENHWGAWAADTYYGELTGDWTDTIVDNTGAFLPWNHNVPGDGKFDQTGIPTEMELQVGRVDLTDLPSYQDNEIELTRKYLEKAHRYKHGEFEIQRRGLIDDNLNIVLGAPAASAYRNFAPMFGAENIDNLDYFSSMSNESYLWSYGGGSGSHMSANGIGTTTDFANDSLLNVFTMLFGSQFGDWDNSDNFLRAPLAQGLTLTNCWAGNPPWSFHHMAMGHHIGYSTIRTQNASIDNYNPGPQLVHTALMGDPSLRMHPVKPPRNFQVDTSSQTIELKWSPALDTNILSYYIYGATSQFGDYFLLHAGPILDTTFTINNLSTGTYYFMIKTLKLEESGSGRYQNLSLGVMDSIYFEEVLGLEGLSEMEVQIHPNPSSGILNLEFGDIDLKGLNIKVLDRVGRLVFEKQVKNSYGGLQLDLESGLYFLILENESQFSRKQFFISR